ncbi:MAG: hypothetical protein WC043_03390 [Pseudobdellovibrionaceae bacterium]
MSLASTKNTFAAIKTLQKVFVELVVLCLLCTSTAFAAVPTIPFTVTMSESVNVTGTPRIVLNVGGATRYATYTAGTGTASLTFTYTATAGDVDLDGIGISSTTLDLNGGTLTDLNGNPETNLTFVAPANMGSVNVNYPSLSMDFIYDSDGRYTLDGTAYNDLSSFLGAAGGSFTRASVGTYFDSAGTLQTAVSGTPRFDYDPITHVARGILIEEARANLFTYSDQFDDVTWPRLNSVISANTVTAPDGSISADTWTRSSTASSYFGKGISKSASALTYTGAIYVKMNIGNYFALRMQGAYPARADIVFNLNTGAISTSASATSSFTAASGSIQSVGNGWYRATLSATSDTHNTIRLYGSFNSNGSFLDGTDSVSNSSGYIWGAQLETGSFPTSYIPTTTAAVTRVADDLSLGSNTLLKQNTWSAVAKTYGMPSGQAGTFLGRNDNIGFGALNGAFGTYKAWSTNGSTNLASNTVNSAYYGGIARTSIGVDTTGRSITANGLIPTSDSVNITAASSSWGRIGSALDIIYLNAHMQNLKIYNKRLSDTQLQLLTQ